MNSPIYLKAFPRSGGTLFVTMLDAHPNIAMSYETYEQNLFNKAGYALSASTILDWLEEARGNSNNDIEWIKALPEKNLQVFLFRARRSGLNVSEVMEVLGRLNKKDVALSDSYGRLEFIDSLMREKMQKAAKEYWGGKTQADLYSQYKRHPSACFFIMIRDVRDIFASMQNKGNFSYTAGEVAKLWRERVLEFREFVSQCRPKAMEVRYEQLVNNPELVLTNACQVAGIKYDSEMLHYHIKEMTLFKNPHGHLSSKQLQKGLNAESVGRWKMDLNSNDVDAIMLVAGDLIDE